MPVDRLTQTMIFIKFLPSAVITLLWVATATDLLDRRIPNWISLAIGILFLAYLSLNFQGLPLLDHLLWASGTFVVLFVLFVLGKIGGGDVKLTTAVMLWAGPDQGIKFLYLMGLSGGVIALIVMAPALQHLWYWIRGQLGYLRSQDTRCTPRSIPYGLAISVAGTICLYDGFLTID